jgi:hypothetical protein
VKRQRVLTGFAAAAVAAACLPAGPAGGAGTGGTGTGGTGTGTGTGQGPGPDRYDPNPCLTAEAAKLLCPTVTISKPSSLYFERRSSGHLVLRATSSLNSVGKGPVELHGKRTGPYSMSATQRIYKRGGGYITVRTGARLGFKSIPGQYRYWKLRNAARFELWSVDSKDRPVKRVRTGPKILYCLRDLKRTRPSLRGSPRSFHYPGCSQSNTIQRVTLGTSVGWSDIYPATYHEQWIDVTGLHGRFRFVMIAAPTGAIYTTQAKPARSSAVVNIP